MMNNTQFTQANQPATQLIISASLHPTDTIPINFPFTAHSIPDAINNNVMYRKTNICAYMYVKVCMHGWNIHKHISLMIMLSINDVNNNENEIDDMISAHE